MSEAPASLVVFLQHVERVAFAEMYIRDAIELLFRRAASMAAGAMSMHFDMLAAIGNGEREAALVAEAVEHFAGGIAPGGPVIFPLVEKRAGFLALRQIVGEE